MFNYVFITKLLTISLIVLFTAVNLDINVKNGQGETPLMVAVHQDQIDVVKHLHKAGRSSIKANCKGHQSSVGL